ncbi:cytochrome P450 81Q32-like [Rutidosis leptorrhynchoides]|uniref:cytochrome P450 81Q32-like n=1 Tax=Rutidosis leptorrhynchoides TaxID=125765 RepID=UPI003A9A34EE
MDHVYITLAILSAFSFLFVTKFRRKPPNLPPTIFPTIPIIGHLYLLKKPLYKTFATLSAKHGPILLLRFGSRCVLLVSSPSLANECFTKNDIIFANRPRLLTGKILGSNYTSIGWAPYGAHWRNLRKISTVEIFSSHRLQELQYIRANEGQLVVGKLLSECSSPVNLKTMFHELTLNLMMRMIAGKRYFGGDDMDVEGNRFKEILRESVLLAGSSNLGDYIPILNWLGVKGLEPRLIALQKMRDEFFQGLIDQHRNIEVGNKKNTMIQVLLKLQETDPEYYTNELIKTFVLNLISAGIDTTAATMEWAFALLLNHPQVLKKAQNEIDTHVGEHRLVDESDITSLHYLHCIVNETLRMYHPAPLPLPHESSEDCVVGGYHIPRGTTLIVNLWSLHHGPNLWSEPETFDPERFKGIEGTRDDFRFMPFGSGRRICPGDELSMRMIELILGLLIQCFNWERVGEEMVDMSEGPGFTMAKAHPLLAKCRPRPMTFNLVSQV